MKNKIIKVVLILGMILSFTSGCVKKENGKQYRYVATPGYEVKVIYNNKKYYQVKQLFNGMSRQTKQYSISNTFEENKYKIVYLDIQKLFMDEENVSEISYTAENVQGSLYAKAEEEKLPTSYSVMIHDDNVPVKLTTESTETLYLRLYSEWKNQSAAEEQKSLIEMLEKVLICADITYKDGTTITKYAQIESSSEYSVSYLKFYEVTSS